MLSNEDKQSYGAIGNLASDDDASSNVLKRLQLYTKICGLFYVVIIICGFSAEMGVVASLLDYESPSITAENITNHPLHFNSGLILNILMCTSDVIVAVLLANVLVEAGANPALSILASMFRFLQTATEVATLMHWFAASILLAPTNPFSEIIISSTVFGDGEASTDLAQDLAYLFLLLMKYGYLLALVFFGISLFLFGVIIFRYGIFPKAFAYLMGLAGLGYIIDSFLYFLASNYAGEWTDILMIPAIIAEFGFTGWLLFGKVEKAVE